MPRPHPARTPGHDRRRPSIRPTAGTIGAGTPPALRGQRARVLADARLCLIPLAVAASVAAHDGALDRPEVLAAVAAYLVWAAALWVVAQGAGRFPGALTEALDVTLLLVVILVADPRDAALGRVPLLALLGTWAVVLPQRGLWWRGAAVVVVIGAATLARHGVSAGLQATALTLVVLAIAAGAARRLAERRARMAAIEQHASDLQAEVADLERRERARIAQLLHDDALQRLLAARQDLEQGVDGDADALARAFEGLGEATQALRSLTLVTHDDALQSAGLESAVQRLAEEAAVRARLTATVAVDPTLDGDLGPVVLPIVRELVANVERHAQATSLDVELRRETGGLSVTVRDDGRGVSPAELTAAARAGHLGISSLSRRVEELQGTLVVDGEGRGGTQVRVTLADDHVRARLVLDEVLRNERSWNAALVAGFPDPFLVITPDLRVVEVSDGFIAATGWSRAELLAAPPGRLPYLPVDQAPEILARWGSSADAHRTATSDEVLVCRDGRRLDVLASVRHVRDPRGRRTLRLVTFKDISDRLVVERRLRAERDISNAIQRVMRDAYLQTLDGVIIDCNERFCELTGYTREQVVGAERPYFFFPPEHFAQAFAFATAVEREGDASARLWVRRADGLQCEVDVVGAAVRDADGERLGRVISVRAADPALPPLGPPVPFPPDGA